jgi:glycosyltransferase involved in cell wall biosynthesis
MRIAQLAPLIERVPPRLYGGTERVVSVLTESLVGEGHDVTLYASGDSITRARLVSVADTPLRMHPTYDAALPHHLRLIERVVAEAATFDLIHSHLDYLFFPFARRLDTPVVTTVHGRLDMPDLPPIYAEYSEMGVVSISDTQRIPLPQANWLGTVYHGFAPDSIPFAARPQHTDYAVFLGRLSREKRPDLAIEAAQLAGLDLKIAAKIDDYDVEYVQTELDPLLRQPWVEYLGELDDARKYHLLGGAQALLFLIDWPEPFGLVMIESLACGTPVIARPCGSVPEIIRDGVTGFLVDSAAEAARAIRHLGEIDRHACRADFEERFSNTRMTRDYVRIYEHAIAAHAIPGAAGGSGRG